MTQIQGRLNSCLMTTKIVAASAAVFMMSACGSSFQPNGSASASGNNSSSSTGGSGGNGSGTNSSAWKNAQLQGAVVGGQYDKVQVVSIDKTAMELVLDLPLPLIGSLTGVSAAIPIPQIPGATLGIVALSSGGNALSLRIPLSDVIHGITSLPPSTLPNGDPLPAIPAGELPGVAVQLPFIVNTKASVYLSASVVAIYVNSPINPYISLTLPIQSADKTQTLGYFSTIPAKSATVPGGFFISFQMPAELAVLIDDNL